MRRRQQWRDMGVDPDQALAEDIRPTTPA